MPTGLEISTDFIHEVVWPALSRGLDGRAGRLAIAVIGTGSDVQGLDDQISRDHHWGPRANVLLLPEDAGPLHHDVKNILDSGMPASYRGFPVVRDTLIMTGLTSRPMDEFFQYFLGTAALPQSHPDWLRLCEVDLHHVTSGRVVIDGPGELTRRRGHLRYYPDEVWMKRIADWCMYLTGRDAPYNLHRLAKRGDRFTASLYKANYLHQAMELTFALNRRYAPYTKWLHRVVATLPLGGTEVVEALEEIHGEDDLHRNVHQMIGLNYLFAEMIADLGLATPPKRVPFDDGLTVLTLYDTAAQIYSRLPAELFAPSFNRVQLWERLARDVLFDSNDYFSHREEGRH